MAFLGLSFRFWAVPPPNQPQIPDILLGDFETESLYCETRDFSSSRGRCLSSVAGDDGGKLRGGIDGGVRRKQAAV